MKLFQVYQILDDCKIKGYVIKKTNYSKLEIDKRQSFLTIQETDTCKLKSCNTH